MLLVGSYARDDARPDSDVDLILLCRQPTELLNDRAWINDFGVVKRECVENWGRLTSVRVWYARGLEVEFGVSGVDWAVAEGTDEVLRGGFQVLLDRDGLFERP
jgi:predicted nucleotidyltransferase